MILATHMLIEHDRVVERPAQVIFVGENYDHPFDARPGDVIIVVMDPDGAPVDRCLDFGGEPIFNPYTTITTCEGVDF
jgi:hypothetical protein